MVSKFPYDYKLILEFDNLARGVLNNLSEKASIINNLYEIASSSEDLTEETIKSVLTNLAYFTSKTIINDANISTFERLLENNDSGYSLALYLLSHDFPGVELPLLSVFLNLTRRGNLLIIQPYHYGELKNIHSLSYDAFTKWIEGVEKDNKKYTKERKSFTKEQIDEFAETIATNSLIDFLQIKQLRIFGSYASGKNGKYSDIDFIVITDDSRGDEKLTRDLLGKTFTDYFGRYVDIIVVDVNKQHTKFEMIALLNSRLLREFDNV